MAAFTEPVSPNPTRPSSAEIRFWSYSHYTDKETQGGREMSLVNQSTADSSNNKDSNLPIS